MKSFVHGNMDSIALDQKYNKFLLGETSFLKRNIIFNLKWNMTYYMNCLL